MARKYIKSIICAIFILSATQINAQDLVILHTNDTHSQITPQTAGDGKGLGGYERREEYIKSVRAKHPNVLLLDAGDFSQGTPYFTIYKGFVEVELMNELGYDATALGNHEYDNGQKELAQRVDKANFPMLCANYEFEDDSPLYNKIKPYTIIEKGGKKIGIIGITLDLEGLVSPKNLDDIEYQQPYPIINKLAAELKDDKKCDLVILLTHVGYDRGDDENPTDNLLAANTKNVDIIVGGHSHTFIEEPTIIKNLNGKDVIIVHASEKGNLVGRLDINF